MSSHFFQNDQKFFILQVFDVLCQFQQPLLVSLTKLHPTLLVHTTRIYNQLVYAILKAQGILEFHDQLDSDLKKERKKERS